MITEQAATRRRVLLNFTALGGWATVPFMVALTPIGQSHRLSLTDDGTGPPPGGTGTAWFTATVVMTAVVGGMSAMAALDALHVLRDSGPRPGWDQNFTYVSGVALGALLWFVGGIASAFSVITTSDCGTGGSAPCLDHPGPAIQPFFLLCMVAPTLLLGISFWLGVRSQVFALLTPPLIAGMYLLGVHLHLPHVGFGDLSG
ncbi:hypothetical protein AB0L06_17005 [Spirillospora sp. NPDC052269]